MFYCVPFLSVDQLTIISDVTPFPTHRSCLTSTLWQTSPAQYMQQDVADSYLTAPTFLQHSHTQQDTSASWLQHYSLPHYYTRLHYPALHHHRPAPPPTPCWQNYDTQTRKCFSDFSIL